MKRLLLALAIVLAGCGSASSSSPRTPPARATSAEATVTAGQTAGGSVHPPGWGAPAPPSVQLPVRPTSLAAVATATMYDSTELSTVPHNPFALAGYTAGSWPTYLPMRATWPNAHTVSIAIASWFHADCLDVEPGDAPPWIAPAWVVADLAAGFAKPCVYSSYWEFVHEVRPALARAGVSRGSIFEWDADYTYRPHIDISFDATQWTDRAFNRNLDASVVTRPFLSIAQPPLVEPHPHKPTKQELIAILRADYRRAHCNHYPIAHRPHKCQVWARRVKELLKGT